MKPLLLSVTIIAFNEEANIARAIRSVSWADEILVVDSGSTDATVKIATDLHAKVIHHPWKGYGQQKNFAQNQAAHEWILNIDADEEVPLPLAEEIRTTLLRLAQGEVKTGGFYLPRKTYYLGHWIQHGGWYPNYLIRLADRRLGRWSEPQVHEKWEVATSTRFQHPLNHYAFPRIEDQILTNLKFARLGAADLKAKGQRGSLIRLIFKPLGKFFETFFLKKGFLDGLPGFIISVNATYSMFMKYAFLLEEDLKHENPDHRQYPR